MMRDELELTMSQGMADLEKLVRDGRLDRRRTEPRGKGWPSSDYRCCDDHPAGPVQAMGERS
jgi:hypothetical protein